MRILMIVMLSLSFGLVLTLFPVGGLWPFGAALLLLGIVFLVFRRKNELRLGLVLLAGGVGLIWGLVYREVKILPVQAYAGNTMELWAQATSYSQATEYGIQVEAELFLPTGKAKATLWLPTEEGLQPGDRVKCTLRLKDSGQSNQYFRYSEGCFLSGYGSGEAQVEHGDRIPVKYYPAVIAHSLEEALEQAFDGDVLGYAMALTTGNRQELSEVAKANLKLSGIYHALALSGMHMAVLVSTINYLVLKRKRLRALVGIPVCVAFTLITGCSPSVVRACVMQCLCLSAYLFRREKDTPTALSLALGLMMLENPWCIVNWGLQLSFLSVIGIELWGQKFQNALLGKRKRGSKMVQKLRAFVASSLGTTGGAMLMTMPLMGTYFGFISLISPLTNILTASAISLCFGGSLITGLTGLVLPRLSRVMGWILGWGFRYTDRVAAMLSGVPFGQVYTDDFYGIVLLIMIYLVFFLVYRSRRRIIPLCCGGCVFGVCMLLILLEGLRPSVTALDVGQGQCVLLRNRGGTIMVDCGGNGENAGEIAAEYLASRGEACLDLLILTHFDDDHINGVSQLLERTKVQALAVPEMECQEQREILAQARNLGVDIYRIRQDTSISLGGDPVTVFSPLGDGADNESGLSVLADLGDFEVLITGDMSETTEGVLLARKEIPKVDVLMAGHHGAKTSTSEELLRQTDPGCVIISVGENRYGHPTEEVISRIQGQGAILYRTDQDGNVTIKGA